MRYLITGGAGFIGSHLVEKLLSLHHDVIVVDDLSTGNLGNLGGLNVSQVYTEKIQDMELDGLKDIDGVFHLAAQASVPISVEFFYKSSENNILSTVKVFDLARTLGIPVVYASSSAIYGELPEGDDNNDVTDLGSPYAVDKLTSENYATMAHQLYSVPSIGLRFFNIYGPRQDPNNPYSGVIPVFMEKVINEKVITVFGGHQTRDFVYVKDAVKLVYKSMEMLLDEKLCEKVNICTGRSITIDALLKDIATIVQKEPEIEYQSLPDGDPEKSLGTHTKMCQLLGISLGEFTQLSTGLKETIKYFQDSQNEI
jgi:UDP-glucose 4-epimerase